MAVPVADSIALTGDAFIDGLTQGGSWQFGGPQTLTYSLNINDDGAGGPGPGGNWTAGMSGAFAQALAEWSNVANLSFQQITSGTYYFESTADMAITPTGNELQQLGAVAIAVFPDPDFADLLLAESAVTRDAYPLPEGDVAFDNFSSLFATVTPGGSGFYIFLHEIGHALGLKHADDDGGNGRPTFAALGIGAYESTAYTVMDSNLASAPYPMTPMILDIAAIQHIYGANLTYHAGNDVYSLMPGAYRAIWDAGGADTIDATSWAGLSGVLIDLHAGAFSGDRTGAKTTGIAFDVAIENATGSAGPDMIFGNDAANSLNGLAGGDTLDGGLGVDTLYGAAGDDVYVVDDPGDVVYEVASSGVDVVVSPVSDTLAPRIHVEHLTLSGNAAIGGRGNALANVITGNAAANDLSGADGNDSLIGGGGDDRFDWVSQLRGGSDTMVGGPGDDRYNVGDGDVVIENPGEGPDTAWADFDAYHLAQNVENLVLWGAGDITAAGNALGNRMTGNSGANAMDGLEGDDTLDGGAGDDILTGGAGNDLFDWESSLRGGNDTMWGGAGDDQFNLSAGDLIQEFIGHGTDTVWVDFPGTYLLGSTLENLTLWGAAAGVDGRGNGGNNVIRGNAAANFLDGGDGDDSMLGGGGDDRFDWVGSLRGGNDTMWGGAGDDHFSLSGGDLVVEQPGEGLDTAWADFDGYALPANVENLSLWGSAPIGGTGNALDNVLTGNTADNVLDGGPGDDTLIGATGDDTFIYDAADASVQGRLGADTLRIAAGGVNLDLAGLAGTVFTGIEIVDLTGTGDNSLTVSLADVLAISSETDTLRVDGDAGDTVNAGSGWADLGVSGSYHSYAQGAAILEVGVDLTQNIFP